MSRNSAESAAALCPHRASRSSSVSAAPLLGLKTLGHSSESSTSRWCSCLREQCLQKLASSKTHHSRVKYLGLANASMQPHRPRKRSKEWTPDAMVCGDSCEMQHLSSQIVRGAC